MKRARLSTRLAGVALLLACALPAAASGLETKVEALVKRLRRERRLAPDERTAWSVYDIASNEKLVSINEDEPFQAASLVKPFIALAYLHEVAARRRRYTYRERRLMEMMIRDSDNAAADWFLRSLGGPAAVQRLLKREYGGILRDLRLVEYIPASGRTYRNRASAHDYSRFLYALWNGDLPRSEELRRVLGLPKRDRLVDGAAVPRSIGVYDKTGTTSRLCGDMGVLVARGADGRQYPYIVVGLIQKRHRARRYLRWMRQRGDVIRAVSGLVYHSIASRHKLSAPGVGR